MSDSQGGMMHAAVQALSAEVRLSRLCAHLERVSLAQTVREIWDDHLAFLRDYGFCGVNYGFVRSLAGRELGEKQDAMFLTSYSESYAHGFFDNGFYLRTAMFRWSVQNTGACSWGWAWKERKAGRLSDDEIVTLEANWRVGIRAGYTLSFGTIAPLYRGAMGLAAPSDVSQTSVDRFWDDFGAEILTASNMVHLKITQLPNAGQYPALTPRQREVLRWVADGKTTQDIATLLGLSVGTVEKHLRLARDTLGVETTAHAVAKASFLNQLNYG